MGTPQYMAPEQVEGKPVDSRTDIFAFGSVLHELLTGQRAFAGNSLSSIMAAVLASEPAPVSKLRPKTPAEIDRIVSACLAKDPGGFQTAGCQAPWVGLSKPRLRRHAKGDFLGRLLRGVGVRRVWRRSGGGAPRPVERPLRLVSSWP